MSGKLDWYGDDRTSEIESEMKKRILRCCILVANRAKELLNVDGTGIRKAKVRAKGTRRDANGRFLKGSGARSKRPSSLVYGANPSKPGEPPRKQRGRLLGSVAFEVVDMIGRVGTNLKYGRWLELGTRLTAARPWLRRALKECREEVLAILSKFMR